MNQTFQVLEKAAISGTITALASVLTTGGSWKVPCPRLLNFTSRVQTIPLYLFTGMAGAATSLVNDGVHKLIRNEVNINKKAQDEASLYLGVLTGAAAYWGVIYFLNPYLPRDIGTTTLITTGALAEISSSFAYNLLKG